MIRVKGLELVNALFCPHYDIEKDRKSNLKKIMLRTYGVAIAADNCSALEVIDDEYRIIKSKNNANIYKVYWKDKKFHQDYIQPSKEFMPLDSILNK